MLLQGLAKDPDDRWPTATEMVGRLDDALDAPPTEATRAMPPTPATRRTPPPPPPRSEPLPVRRRRFGGAALLAGLAGLLLVAVAAAVLLSGGGNDPKPSTAAKPTPTKTATPAKKKKAEKTPTPTPSPTATATATTATATATATPPPSNGGVDLAKAAQLQTAGFSAGNSGDFNKDLQLSQQALKACGDTQRLSPCGYASYEVGRSLVELGRPSEAIPYLERRLAYGDSTGQVQRMLDRAKAEASGGSSASGKGKGKGDNKG